ncbi:Na/Pi cotransporter family protein [Coprobacter tertius]|uniref:Na/Pi cotransporter family protein n=1 Tax=Coprobacter tertius TaxID=2944915 RepID=A0ABT1MDL4_9BACT|nr:Na/Pi cotransporter family protein [Coprobacter tertius]MCP9610727.1 Na/Pi cotransporter family protein [Coprobacter tertius]
MEYTFFDFLTLIGSLGLFLYGMKVMSEGLQKVAGDRLRSILTAMTTNRFTGVLTGVLITALIQSSSATTVMVVSFVNAGLLSLVQSISVIMGANVGTTVTAWIISIFGFKVNISLFAIPLIGLAIPFIFSGNSRRRSWGEFIIGFAFLFMGLDFLKNSVPDLQSNPEILAFLSEYTNMGFLSVLLFLLIGSIITIIVQSSSATMAITLIMCSKGWISFDIAAAMVLGENIGTTITANLAAISGNVSAKRAAFAHFMFNIFGVCWVLLLFFPFTRFIAYLVGELTGGSPSDLINFIQQQGPDVINKISNDNAHLTGAEAALRSQYQGMQVTVSYALSLFHTVFNIANVLIMIWFVNFYVYIVTRVIKVKHQDDEEFQLKFISGGLLSTSELSLLQVKKEIGVFAERTNRMFGMVRDLIHEKEGSESYSKIFSRIEKYEKISDRMDLEIAAYLNNVADGRLSYDGKLQVSAMLTMTSEIESIGDSCFHLARTLQRKQESKTEFTEGIIADIDVMMRLVSEALENMISILTRNDVTEADFNKAYNKEMEINNFRNQLRTANIENINSKKYEYQSGTHFMDIISECEKLGDYIINVIEAVKEKRKIN